jgi:hypothetical protein
MYNKKLNDLLTSNEVLSFLKNYKNQNLVNNIGKKQITFNLTEEINFEENDYYFLNSKKNSNDPETKFFQDYSTAIGSN